jgi:DnaJ homolog subfamily C member 10
VGFHSADDLLEFIDDALSPSVQQLDEPNFDSIVHGRAAGQLFFVDFFAPWCGPCQQVIMEDWAKLFEYPFSHFLNNRD